MRLRWDRLASLAPGGLSVVGFGFLSAAAWAVALPFGLAAIGVSLLGVGFMAERGSR